MRAVRNILFVAVFWCVPLVADDSAGIEQSAALQTGQTVTGRLKGSSPADLVFETSAGKSLALQTIRVIRPGGPRAELQSLGPRRRIVLWGGELISGEVLGWQPNEVRLRLRGEEFVRTVPAGAIAGVHQPAGEIVVVYEDFERTPTVWKGEQKPVLSETHARSGELALQLRPASGRLSYRVNEPISAGRMELSFFDAGNKTRASGWRASMMFETPLGSREVRFRLAGTDDGYRVSTPRGPRLGIAQKLRRKRGWHRLTVKFDEAQTAVDIDGNVLTRGPAMQGVLTAVHLAGSTAGKASGSETRGGATVWVDDFKIHRRIKTGRDRFLSRDSDMIVLADGDELYGTIQDFDTGGIRLRGRFGEVRLGWHRVLGLATRPRPRAAKPRAVSGWIARIELSRPAGGQHVRPDSLFVAIRSVQQDRLIVEHAFLGRIELPLRDVLLIAPAFAGVERLVDGVPRHLGDEIRADFPFPVPDGHLLRVELQLSEPVNGAPFVVLDVDNLEPSGKKTATTNPFLKQLRAGHLQTVLYLNGKRVGSLNRQISERASVQFPQRIRIPVASDLFKVGLNELEIRQQPSATDASDYDDFNLRRIGLQIEQQAGR